MPEPRMAYITKIDGYLRNTFEIAAKNKFQRPCEDLAETKFNKRLPWWNWCGKNKTEEIAKAVREKVYKNTEKYGIWWA